ncbi:MAG: hypothetical protein EAY75_00720 [Bacteroidetes bacterium]|nr:MAG: hypothetical protein EAY75_00720 [Bacteroidota bacterium]
MKAKIIYCMLFVATGLQSCFYKGYEYVNVPYKDDPNDINIVDSNGYVNSGLYNLDDDGVHSSSFAKYKIDRASKNVMQFDLLKLYEPTLRIFDTLSFHFDFEHFDSSYYRFTKNEYLPALKQRKIEKTDIPLVYTGKLTNIKDCNRCTIYKYESSYGGKCHDWFFSDSIGFLKTYGPYSGLESNVNDYEIGFLLGTHKYYYALKLLEAIKADKQFHTRCTPGTLW